MECRHIFTALTAAFVFSTIAFSQPAFEPRSGAEAQAWQVYRDYVSSRANEDRLIRGIQAQRGDTTMGAYGYGAIRSIDVTDSDLLNQMRFELEVERQRKAQLLETWNRFFYWRYGDLTDADKPSEGAPGLNKIEFALRNFKFYRDPGAPNLLAGVTARKGGPDAWSDVRVTLTNVSDMKTADQQGWRNNGTGFTASAASGPVGITIEIVAKGAVSYYDYDVGVVVKTSAGQMILDNKAKISKDGGMKNFAAQWDAGQPGDLAITASISGGNPEGFTYYVSGTVRRVPGQIAKGNLPPGIIPPVRPTTGVQPYANDFLGTWDISFNGNPGKMEITRMGNAYTGRFDLGIGWEPMLDIFINGKTINFRRAAADQRYTGSLSDGSLTGTFSQQGSGSYPWSGKKRSGS